MSNDRDSSLPEVSHTTVPVPFFEKAAAAAPDAPGGDGRRADCGAAVLLERTAGERPPGRTPGELSQRPGGKGAGGGAGAAAKSGSARARPGTRGPGLSVSLALGCLSGCGCGPEGGPCLARGALGLGLQGTRRL